MNQIIYKVTTEGDCEGKSTKHLGYATGHPTDIKNYFDDKKYYDIWLEQIKVVNITTEDATDRQKLVKKRKEINRELKELNSALDY